MLEKIINNPYLQKYVTSFELSRNDIFLGWLVFQIDPDMLANNYGMDEEDLKRFRFETS